MSTFASLLTALAAPIAKRVMVALGFGFVTSAGIITGVELYLGKVVEIAAGLPADAIQLLGMSGFFQGLGIIAGAVVARLSVEPLKRLIPQ